MKHKPNCQRAGPVEISAPLKRHAITGTASAGTIFTRTGTHALAYYRYGPVATAAMQAGDAHR